jgi:APA family basic amino acid/polyamine antiporter
MQRRTTSVPEPALRRAVSMPWLVLYGLGTTIGAGIYALTGVVAGRAGMHAPLAFLLAALIALFSAFSFAELCSRFPRAGGEAVYVKEGFGRVGPSVAVGVLVVLAGLISAATVCVGFSGYLAEFVALPKAIAVIAVMLLLGVVAGWGVRESVTAAGLVTLLEIGGLLAVIAFGGPHLLELPARAPEIFRFESGAGQAVGSAAVLAFYAFLGFEDMVNVAEEVHDVRRTLPIAILVTIFVTTLLYALVSAVAVLAVPPVELGASAAPLSLVFERCGGSAQALGVVAIVALLNGALIQVIKASRVLYGMAGQGGVPAAFGRVNRRTRTPLVATAFSTVLAALLAATLPLETLAQATSFVTLVTFAVANLALLRVKRRDPRPVGVRVFPLWIPAVGFVLTCGLIVLDLAIRVSAA